MNTHRQKSILKLVLVAPLLSIGCMSFAQAAVHFDTLSYKRGTVVKQTTVNAGGDILKVERTCLETEGTHSIFYDYYSNSTVKSEGLVKDGFKVGLWHYYVKQKKKWLLSETRVFNEDGKMINSNGWSKKRKLRIATWYDLDGNILYYFKYDKKGGVLMEDSQPKYYTS